MQGFPTELCEDRSFQGQAGAEQDSFRRLKLRAVLGLLRRCSLSAVSGSYQVKPTFAPPTPPVKPGTGGTVPGVTQVSPKGRGPSCRNHPADCGTVLEGGWLFLFS